MAKDMHETSQGKGCTEVPLQVQGSEKMKLEVPCSVRAQLRVVNNYKIGEKCTAVPLQVQGNDKTKLEVHGSVRAWLKVKNNYKIRGKVHRSATAGARQCLNEVRGAWLCQSTVKG